MRKNWLILGVLLAQVLLPIWSVQAVTNFQDVSDDYVYSQAIQSLKERNIVRGYDGVHFGPNNPITRAELLKIALEGAGIDTAAFKNSTSPFPDVDKKNSLRQYIIYAQQEHIVSGYADGTYRPSQPTTRAEAIKILLNINAITVPKTVTTSPYTDLLVNDALAPYVVTAHDKKIIPGKFKTTTLGTGELIQRGEVAEMMYRLLYLRDNTVDIYPEKAPVIGFVAGNFANDVFHGVTFQAPLPKTLVANTYYPITVQTAASELKLIIEDADGKQSMWRYKSDSQRVTFDLFFPSAGMYKVGLSIDDAVKVIPVVIAVVPAWQLGTAAAASVPEGAQFVTDNDARVWLQWNTAKGLNLLDLSCRQGATTIDRFILSSGDKWELDYKMFAGFAEGDIICNLSQASADSLHSTVQPLSAAYSWKFQALTHYFRTWNKNDFTIEGALPLFTDASQLQLKGHANIPLSNNAEMILANGSVLVFNLQSGTDSTINSGIDWQLDLKLTDPGVYFLELNDTEGLAVLNTPIYRVQGVPILPDFVAMQDGLVLTNKAPLSNTEKQQMTTELLSRINALRTQLGRSSVILDPDLSVFAQAHADDMVAQNYFSHKDKDGRGPNQRKLAFNISLSVGENIARSTDLNAADEGLKRSAAHRWNMILPQWTRVGIGIARGSDGLLYTVEEFSIRSFISQPMTSDEKTDLIQKTLDRINENRATQSLPALSLGTDYASIVTQWENDPVPLGSDETHAELHRLLLAAGMQLGRIVADHQLYSPNFPAELALQPAISNANFDKISVGIGFEGESMWVLILLY